MPILIFMGMPFRSECGNIILEKNCPQFDCKNPCKITYSSVCQKVKIYF